MNELPPTVPRYSNTFTYIATFNYSSMLLLAAGIDPNLTKLFFIGIVIFGLCLLLRTMRQPYAVAYILAGVMLGEHGFSILPDQALITSLGEFGLILLFLYRDGNRKYSIWHQLSR